MFDTHCHLNLSEYFSDPEDIIVKAREAGVDYLLIPGTDLQNSRKAVDLANTFENVYASVGVHPTVDLEKMGLGKTITALEELIEEDKKIVAVGEIGLDYYHLNTPVSIQKEFLISQIKLALKHNLSIILHNRHATEDILPLLRSLGWDNLVGKTVFHCCEPNLDILDLVVKHNLFIGIDGDVTYDETKAEFIKKVPLSNLVLETDSPFLTPQPKKEGDADNNSPVNLIYVARKVATLKNIKLEKVIFETLQNSKKLFNISTY